MSERPDAVTFQGQPLTLIGDEAERGQPAPDFTVLDTDLNETHLSDYRGKIILLVSVPSLDTPVCDAEARHFNEEARKLGEDVAVLTISMDLPFAQARWCGAKDIDAVRTLSDHRDASFGMAYGLLIKELRLLARAVLIVDRSGTIAYKQLVGEIAQEPDYDAVLSAARELM